MMAQNPLDLSDVLRQIITERDWLARLMAADRRRVLILSRGIDRRESPQVAASITYTCGGRQYQMTVKDVTDG